MRVREDAGPPDYNTYQRRFELPDLLLHCFTVRRYIRLALGLGRRCCCRRRFFLHRLELRGVLFAGCLVLRLEAPQVVLQRLHLGRLVGIGVRRWRCGARGDRVQLCTQLLPLLLRGLERRLEAGGVW